MYVFALDFMVKKLPLHENIGDDLINPEFHGLPRLSKLQLKRIYIYIPMKPVIFWFKVNHKSIFEFLSS